jgi:hypothetical protein
MIRCRNAGTIPSLNPPGQTCVITPYLSREKYLCMKRYVFVHETIKHEQRASAIFLLTNPPQSRHAAVARVKGRYGLVEDTDDGAERICV